MPFDPLVHAVTLTCHPETPSDALRRVSARVRRNPGTRLAGTYVLEGDLERVRVPAPRIPRIASRLWQHTCCEIFIACKGMRAYQEFNFSPSGEWATYAFEGYRSPRLDGSGASWPAPEVVVRAAPGNLELHAVIRLDRLAAFRPGMLLLLALAAVIEESSGVLSYWALRHPPGKPDFHHSEAFALELQA
jgi:hypothetical protein